MWEPGEAETRPKSQTLHFEWTPELEAVRARTYRKHPDIPSLDMEGTREYTPGMPLPDYDDKFGMLRFCGLNDKMIGEVISKLQSSRPDTATEPAAYATKSREAWGEEEKAEYPHGRQWVEFPLLQDLEETYFDLLRSISFDQQYDYEESHEGCILKGIELGLRPEFAIFCTLHDDDPRRGMRAGKDCWPYPEDPVAHTFDTVEKWYYVLRHLWRAKLEAEGIIKHDERGSYVLDKIDMKEDAVSEN